MVILKRIGVIKTACFLGIFGVFIGLIFGIIMFIVMSIVVKTFGSVGGGLIDTSNLIFNAWYVYLIIIPLASGVLNFLAGLIFTPIANLVLKIIKGLDLDIEMQEGQPVVNS